MAGFAGTAAETASEGLRLIISDALSHPPPRDVAPTETTVLTILRALVSPAALFMGGDTAQAVRTEAGVSSGGGGAVFGFRHTGVVIVCGAWSPTRAHACAALLFAWQVGQDVVFRFENVTALCHDVAARRKGPALCPRLHNLTVNYRSHEGIVRAAAALCGLLTSHFPAAVDKLPEERAFIRRCCGSPRNSLARPSRRVTRQTGSSSARARC